MVGGCHVFRGRTDETTARATISVSSITSRTVNDFSTTTFGVMDHQRGIGGRTRGKR